MTTRLQRRFGIATEEPGAQTVPDKTEKPVKRQAPVEPRNREAKADPYPTLPRRSLIREKGPGED